LVFENFITRAEINKQISLEFELVVVGSSPSFGSENNFADLRFETGAGWAAGSQNIYQEI